MTNLKRETLFGCSPLGGRACSSNDPDLQTRSNSVPCNSTTADPTTPDRRLEDMSAHADLQASIVPLTSPYIANLPSATIQDDMDDPESHQPSLKGILAMIESAVYPHCTVGSSPPASITSQSNRRPQECAQTFNDSPLDHVGDTKETVKRMQDVDVAKAALIAVPSPTPCSGTPVASRQSSQDCDHIPKHQRMLVDDVAGPSTPDASDEPSHDFRSASTYENTPSHPTSEDAQTGEHQRKIDEKIDEVPSTRDGLVNVAGIEGDDEESGSPIVQGQSGDVAELVTEGDCEGESLPT